MNWFEEPVGNVYIKGSRLKFSGYWTKTEAIWIM
jgi:hypothetical protein